MELLKKIDQTTRSKTIYEEIYFPAFMKKMLKGASDEDWVPPVGRNERSFRHYYDPASKQGKKGVKFYNHFYLWGPLLSAEVSYPRTGYYEGALEWARDEKTGNILNWPGAISAYDYTQSSKEEAYYRLGHVGHLLADMADADHATNTPHPGSGYILPDDLEMMLGDPVVNNLSRLLAANVISGSIDSIKLYLKVAYIKVKNKLLSEDLKLTSFERLIEDYVDLNLVKEFFDEEELKTKIRRSHVENPPRPPISGQSIQKFRILDEYFNDLAKKSKAALARSGLTTALACMDLGKFIAAATTGVAIATANPSAIIYEPIYIIPTIDTRNQEEKDKYLQFAWSLIKESTELNAGLFELFYDIVNHPPYVQQISVYQTEGPGRYWAAWKNKKASKRIEWKNESYEVVTERKIISDDTPFLCGKPARIKITFGPNLESVKVGINPDCVQVAVDGDAVPGRMIDDITWEGSFTPKDLPEGELEKELRIEIAAKDLRNHYPREGLPNVGYELDAFPNSPAKASFQAPGYDWEGYEPGPDKRHSLILRREPEKKVLEEEEEIKEESPIGEKPKYFIWINKCGPAPGGRIHAGSEEEFKAPKRCWEEWLFGTSTDLITKVEISGPCESLEEAVEKASKMISVPWYVKILGQGRVPFAKYNGVDYLIDTNIEEYFVKTNQLK